mmetsp:Transcript_33023/g.43507  ORF Transcript_33023/g.43507 Transcript_33023/m.43507 type:complete len:133 (+) Transcript_33023:1117-1515(+)
MSQEPFQFKMSTLGIPNTFDIPSTSVPLMRGPGHNHNQQLPHTNLHAKKKKVGNSKESARGLQMASKSPNAAMMHRTQGVALSHAQASSFTHLAKNNNHQKLGGAQMFSVPYSLGGGGPQAEPVMIGARNPG